MPSVRDAGRVGGGQREHGPRRLRPARGRGLIVTRHGLGSFVADGAQRLARGRADRRRGDRRRRARPASTRATWRSRPWSPPRCPRRSTPASRRRSTTATAELDLDALAAELDLDDSWLEVDERRRAARAAPPDRPARGRAGGLPPRRSQPPSDADRCCTPPSRGSPASPSSRRPATRCSRSSPRRARRRERRGERERRARAVRDAMVADPAGHRWEVVSAAETGEAGCTTWRVGPADGPARRADELVAGQGLGRMPVSRAARGGEQLMVGAVADRAFLPAKSLFEQVGNMMILTGKTITRDGQAALPLRRRVHRPVPVRAAALLVPDADLDGRLRLRRAGPAGGQLPLACSAPSTASAASSSSPRCASSRRS